MRSNLILSAAAAAMLLVVATGPTQAQQGGAEFREVEDGSLQVPPFNKSVDDLEDMDLVSASGDEIGEVEEVLMDASGQPTALAVEAGGFLGIGEKNVVIGLDQLRLENDQLVTSMTKEQLEGLPEWDD